MRYTVLVLIATPALAAALAGGAANGSLEEARRCSIERTHLPRHAGETAILARALADTMAFPLDRDPGWSEWQARYFDGIDEVHGQAFVVQRVGEGSGIEPGDTLVGVPWAYDPSCFRTPWTEGAAWVPESEVGFFLVEEPEFIVDGWYRADVCGWHDPYPQGSLLRFLGPRVPPRSEWMSAEELFALSVALPPARGGTHEAFLDALRAWVAENPGERDRYPVSAVMDRAPVR